jgi:hypothetical protein
LQVQSRPDSLAVSPGAGFTSVNYVGSAFNYTNEVFTLTNIGPAGLSWSLANTSSWLNVSANYGSLTPGGLATALTVGLSAAATNLPPGSYTTSLAFTDLGDNVVQTRQFTLQILLPIENGGFEAGSFVDWNPSGDMYYTSVSTDSAYVHSGNYGARLGAAGSPGYISQTVQTSAGLLYLVSLWLASPDGETPNEFLVQWNGNTLFHQMNIGAIGWTNLQFLVAGAPGSSVLEFGFQDDPSYLGLDDVSVKSVSAPGFRNVTHYGGATKLVWQATAGATYQVQYKTNLLQTNWLNLGNPFQATNSSASVSDAAPDAQRFYRIELLP